MKTNSQSASQSHAKTGFTPEIVCARLHAATVDARGAELWGAYCRLSSQSRLYQPILDPAVRQAYEAWLAHFNNDTPRPTNIIPFRNSRGRK